MKAKDLYSSVYSVYSVVEEKEFRARFKNGLQNPWMVFIEGGKMTNLKFEEESYQIRGAVFEVYREMGCGFLEAVYQSNLKR